MSPARRRRRRSRAQAGDGQLTEQQTAQTQQHGRRPANWNWRTFPVYFAFSLGAFLGLYLGLIAAYLQEEGNTWVSTGIFIAIAIMLGLGLSRITTNWLVNRRLSRTRKAPR